MLIGLDLRFINDDLYSKFVLNLVTILIIKSSEHEYNLYINSQLISDENKLSKLKNVNIKKVNINNFSIKEQTSFLKILKKDNNNLMIFFNLFKPILYKWEYFIFISSLKDIYYWNFNTSFKKYKYIYLLEKNLKKSRKILCFDQNTKNELIERFNLKEETIFLIEWFFIPKEIKDNKEQLKMNVLPKFWLQKKYFIYSGWDWIEKNIDKLIWVLSKLNKEIDLLIFWDKISKNIQLRNLIIKYSLQNRIKFLSQIKEAEKYILYKQSRWVIFPSLYETFPFHLWEPLSYDIPIIASNLKSIVNVFWEKIDYFSPISKSNMLEKINNFINKKEIKKDYKYIKEKISPEKSIKTLLNIIK